MCWPLGGGPTLRFLLHCRIAPSSVRPYRTALQVRTWRFLESFLCYLCAILSRAFPRKRRGFSKRPGVIRSPRDFFRDLDTARPSEMWVTAFLIITIRRLTGYQTFCAPSALLEYWWMFTIGSLSVPTGLSVHHPLVTLMGGSKQLVWSQSFQHSTDNNKKQGSYPV